MASGLPVLAELRPGALLELVATFGPPDQFPWPLAAHVGQMMAREPERVVDLLVRRSYRPTLVRRGLPPAVLRRLGDLDPSLVAALAGALAESPPHLAKFLKALPPSIRAEVFEQAYDGVEIGTRYWPTLLLGVLPHRRRETEVRRILALRQVQNSPTRTLHLTAFLPITSVRPTLVRLAGRSSALPFALVAPHLPHGTETSVFEVLRDRLGNEEDRAGHDMVIRFTQALGRRAWKLADLQALVGEAARVAPEAQASHDGDTAPGQQSISAVLVAVARRTLEPCRPGRLMRPSAIRPSQPRALTGH